MSWNTYVASGWFSPEWDAELTDIRDVVVKNGIDAFVPRDFFVCPPDASKEVQDATYDGNLEHLKKADFLLANTRNKDMGTIFECGYFRAWNDALEQLGLPPKPIVYYCGGLPPGAKFNLMLSRSGIKVCTSIEELDDYLARCVEAGELLVEEYAGNIE